MTAVGNVFGGVNPLQIERQEPVHNVTTGRVARYAGMVFMGLGVGVSVSSLVVPYLVEIAWLDPTVASLVGFASGGLIAMGGFALSTGNCHSSRPQEVRAVHVGEDVGMIA